MNKVFLAACKHRLVRLCYRAIPVRYTTTAILASQNRDDWTEVLSPTQAAIPKFLPSGPLPREMSDKCCPKFSAKGILRLRNSFVSTHHGWVFTRTGRCVIDLSNYRHYVQVAPPERLPFPRWKARRLHGRTLSLLSTWAASNYFHFLFESLPRIDLFHHAGLAWDDVDHVLLPSFSSATANRLLERLQLPREKLIRVSAEDTLFLQADELICPSFPGERRIVARWSVDFLRRIRGMKPSAPKRRLFVARQARSRLLRNEQDIWTELSKVGFERIDPAFEADAESIFNEAEAVVGIHGAGMANIVFCRPGTRVLELMPSDQCVPFYLSVAVAGNLAYDCLVGRSDRNVARSPHQDYNSPYNFKVSVSAFKQRLRWLLSSE